MIQAEEARKNSEANSPLRKELDRISEEILAASKLGYRTVSMCIQTILLDDCQRAIESAGFKIEDDPTRFGPGYTGQKINW